MSLADEYPCNALASALEGQRRGIPALLCYRLAPGTNRTVVCAREANHGITNMTLPDGRRTYVDHNARHDGMGEGW